MNASRASRRLTAILAADVAGFSRLTAADEEGTLDGLRGHRAGVTDPCIEAHGGRIANTAGDSILAEFPSVVNAVRCAVELQNRMQEQNHATPPDQRIEFRVGIHVGDVVEQSGDLLGDGVNIAARLEGLSDPGGIILSEDAQRQVRGRLSLDLEDLGPQTLKNIVEPVRAYKIGSGEQKIPAAVRKSKQIKIARAAIAGAAAVMIGLLAVVAFLQWPTEPETGSTAGWSMPLPDRPSIAVLPFANLSDDQDQAYFADGMADDLITDLSKLPDLFVIARTSSFAYRNMAIDIREIARRLGVRYVLEGSVRRAGASIRINAQLIDAATGLHVWAERYDGEYTRIFELQDRITSNVVSALSDQLGSGTMLSSVQRLTDNPQAYDAFLRGRELLQKPSAETISSAISHLRHAVALDPDYSRAHAALASAYWQASQKDRARTLDLSRSATSRKASEHLRLALVNPTSKAHEVAAEMALAQFRPDIAVMQSQRAVALEANSASGHLVLAKSLDRAGKLDRAETAINKAIRLDPVHGPEALVLLGQIKFNKEEFGGAETAFKNAVSSDPHNQTALLYLASTYGHLGKQDKAAATFDRFKQERNKSGEPKFNVVAKDRWQFSSDREQKRLRVGLKNLRSSD